MNYGIEFFGFTVTNVNKLMGIHSQFFFYMGIGWWVRVFHCCYERDGDTVYLYYRSMVKF